MWWYLQGDGNTVEKQCFQFNQSHQESCFQAFNECQAWSQLQNLLLKNYTISMMQVPSSNCNIPIFRIQWSALVTASKLGLKPKSTLPCSSQDIPALCKNNDCHTEMSIIQIPASVNKHITVQFIVTQLPTVHVND